MVYQPSLILPLFVLVLEEALFEKHESLSPHHWLFSTPHFPSAVSSTTSQPTQQS